MPKGQQEGQGVGRSARSQRKIDEKRARRKERFTKKGRRKFGSRRPAYKRRQGW